MINGGWRAARFFDGNNLPSIPPKHSDAKGDKVENQYCFYESGWDSGTLWATCSFADIEDLLNLVGLVW